MNKKIVALAVAAAFAIPAAASAQTTLFGQFKYEVGLIEAPAVADGGNGERNAVHSSIGTRLGVMGSEDLGGGMSAIFRFQGSPGGANDPLSGKSWAFNEENWVGLRGGFGTVQLGRSDTAFKKGHTRFRVFPDSLADLNNRPASFGRVEGVHYSSPNFGGATINASLEPNGAELDTYWALGVNYVAGPLFVGAAVESAPDTGTYGNTANRGGGPTIAADGTNWQVGASYKWNDLTVGLLYQDIDTNPAAPGLQLLGAAVPGTYITLPVTYNLGNVGLRAAIQHRDPDQAGLSSALNYALGASYNFSSRTEAFVHLWYDDERRAMVDPAPFGAAAEEVQFGLGLRHSF